MRRYTLKSPILLMIGICLLRGAVVLAQTSPEIDAIFHIYEDNQDRFRNCKCTFRVSRGLSSTATDAWQGRFVPTFVQVGSIIKCEGDFRYEVKCVQGEKTLEELANDNAIAKNNTRSAMTPVQCASRLLLFSKARDTLIAVGPILQSVNIAEHQPPDALFTPFSMGIMGPGDRFSPSGWIDLARSGKAVCEHRGTRVLDGVLVDVMECHLKDEGQSPDRFVWFLDLSRGAVPLKWERWRANGRIDGELRASHITHVPNHGFVAKKSVTVFNDSGGKCTVWMITLDRVDARAPDRSELRFDIPMGWKISNVGDMRSEFQLPSNERFSLDELPKWMGRCDQQLQRVIARQKDRGRPSRPATRPTAWFGGWLLPITVVVAVFALAWFLKGLAKR